MYIKLLNHHEAIIIKDNNTYITVMPPVNGTLTVCSKNYPANHGGESPKLEVAKATSVRAVYTTESGIVYQIISPCVERGELVTSIDPYAYAVQSCLRIDELEKGLEAVNERIRRLEGRLSRRALNRAIKIKEIPPMNKFIAFAITVLLILFIPLGVCAEDVTNSESITTETAEEAAETPTETEEDMAAEKPADPLIEAESELAALLGASTPEQVETVKKYLEYGLRILPLSERVKLIAIDYIGAAAWVLVAIAFVVMGVVHLRSNKKTSDNNTIIINNAIEAVNTGAETANKAAETADKAADRVERVTAAALDAAREIAKNADERFKGAAADLVRLIEEANSEVKATVKGLTDRETAMTEALLLTQQITAYLLEVSELPEVERDSMTVIANRITDKINEIKTSKEVSGDVQSED